MKALSIGIFCTIAVVGCGKSDNLTEQARRLADRTAFFLEGECVEVGETEDIFARKAKDERTTAYVEGRFG